MTGLTLQNRTVHSTRTFQDVEVPWEVEGFESDWLASQGGGFFDLSHWQTIEVAGPDALDFLNRLSTRDLKHAPTELWPIGFLTGKAQIVALGQLHCPNPNRFLLAFPPPQGEWALAHLEQFHFSEDLKLRGMQDEWQWFGLWKQQEGGWQDPADPNLRWACVSKEEAKTFVASQGALLGNRLLEFFRVQAGVPDVGRGLEAGGLVLEAPLDHLISRAKGCYPGQEVVERVFTYGRVNQKLFPVTVRTSKPEAAVPVALEVGGERAGELRFWMHHPQETGGGLGFALVKQKFWDHTGNLSGSPDYSIGLKQL